MLTTAEPITTVWFVANAHSSAPEWKRTAGLASDGTVLVPAAIAGDEEAVCWCVLHDGGQLAKNLGHFYVSSVWMKANYQETIAICERIEHVVRDADRETPPARKPAPRSPSRGRWRRIQTAADVQAGDIIKLRVPTICGWKGIAVVENVDGGLLWFRKLPLDDPHPRNACSLHEAMVLVKRRPSGYYPV